MKTTFAGVAAAVALTACAGVPKLTSTFDPGEVAWFSEAGTNTIRGSALLRQQGGGVVTCAGNEVQLTPASPYARELMTAVYGSPAGGFNRSTFGMIVDPASLDQQYWQTRQSAVCDAQGYFTFRDLPDGEYYLETEITWSVVGNYFPEGGAIGKLIRISGGKLHEVVLSA